MGFWNYCCKDGNYTSLNYGCEPNTSPKHYHIDGAFNPIECQINQWQSLGNYYAVDTSGILWSLSGLVGAGSYIGLPSYANYAQVSSDTDWIKVISGPTTPDIFMKADGSLWSFDRFGINYISDGPLSTNYNVPYSYPTTASGIIDLGTSIEIMSSFHTRTGTYHPYYKLKYNKTSEESPKRGDSILIDSPSYSLHYDVVDIISEDELIFIGSVIIKEDFLDIEQNGDTILYDNNEYPILLYQREAWTKYNLKPERIRARINSSINDYDLVDLPESYDQEYYSTFFKKKGSPPTYLDYLEFSRKPKIYLKYYRPDTFNIKIDTDIDSDGFYHDGYNFVREIDKPYYHTGSDAEFSVAWSGAIDWIRIITPGTGYATPPDVRFVPNEDHEIPENDLPALIATLDPDSSGVLSIELAGDNPPMWQKPPSILISPAPIENTGLSGEITLESGVGAGAYAICEIKAKISEITIKNSGTGYTHEGTEYSRLKLIIQAADDDLLVHGIPMFVTSTPTVSPTNTPTLSLTPSFTPTKTTTPSLTPSVTPTKTITATATTTPSVTPTMTVTKSKTPTPTTTQSFTPTATCSLTASPTLTSTPSNTVSPTPSKSKAPITTRILPGIINTQTPTPTSTPPQSPTPSAIGSTPTPTSSPTPSTTITLSNTHTQTPTKTLSPTPATVTPTPTRTPTNSRTSSNTPTQTPTQTQTQTPSNTVTPTPTQTPTNTLTPSSTSVADKSRRIAQWSIANINLTSSNIEEIEFNGTIPGLYNEKYIYEISDTIKDEITNIQNYSELTDFYIYNLSSGIKIDIITGDIPTIEDASIIVAQFEHSTPPSDEIAFLLENIDGREAYADAPIAFPPSAVILKTNDRYEVSPIAYYINSRTGQRVNSWLDTLNEGYAYNIEGTYYRMIPKDVKCWTYCYGYVEWDPESYYGITTLYKDYLDGNIRAYAGLAWSIPGVSGTYGQDIFEYDPFIGYNKTYNLSHSDDYGGNAASEVTISFTPSVWLNTSILTIGNGTIVVDGHTIEGHERAPSHWQDIDQFMWPLVCNNLVGQYFGLGGGAPNYSYNAGGFLGCGNNIVPENDGPNSSIAYTFIKSFRGTVNMSHVPSPTTVAVPNSMYGCGLYYLNNSITSIANNYKISVNGSQGSSIVSMVQGGVHRIIENNIIEGGPSATDVGGRFSYINGSGTINNFRININDEVFFDEHAYTGSSIELARAYFNATHITKANISLDYPTVKYNSFTYVAPAVIIGNESAKIYFYGGAIAELQSSGMPDPLGYGATIIENASYNKEPYGKIFKNGYDFPIRIGEKDNIIFNTNNVVFSSDGQYNALIDSSNNILDNNSLCKITSNAIEKYVKDYIYISHNQEISIDRTLGFEGSPEIKIIHRGGVTPFTITELLIYSSGYSNIYNKQIFIAEATIAGRYNEDFEFYFITGDTVAWPPDPGGYRPTMLATSVPYSNYIVDINQMIIDFLEITHKQTNLSQILPGNIGVDNNNYVDLLTAFIIPSRFPILNNAVISQQPDGTWIDTTQLVAGNAHEFNNELHINYDGTASRGIRQLRGVILGDLTYSVASGSTYAIINNKYMKPYYNPIKINHSASPFIPGIVPLSGYIDVFKVADSGDYIDPGYLNIITDYCSSYIQFDTNYHVYDNLPKININGPLYYTNYTFTSENENINNISFVAETAWYHSMSYNNSYNKIINSLENYNRLYVYGPGPNSIVATSENIKSCGYNYIIDSSGSLRSRKSTIDNMTIIQNDMYLNNIKFNKIIGNIIIDENNKLYKEI